MSALHLFRKDKPTATEPQAPASASRESFVISIGTVADAMMDDEALEILTPNEKRDLLGRVLERLEAQGWKLLRCKPTPGHTKLREPLRQLAEIMCYPVSGYRDDLVWRINAVHEFLNLRGMTPEERQAFRPYPLPERNKEQRRTEKMLEVAARQEKLKRLLIQLAYLLRDAPELAEEFEEQLGRRYNERLRQQGLLRPEPEQ